MSPVKSELASPLYHIVPQSDVNLPIGFLLDNIVTCCAGYNAKCRDSNGVIVVRGAEGHNKSNRIKGLPTYWRDSNEGGGRFCYAKWVMLRGYS